MRRKSMKLVLANLALAALMSGFTCATFEQNGNRLTFFGRYYEFDTNDGFTYCGFANAYQVSSSGSVTSLQGTDQSGIFRVVGGPLGASQLVEDLCLGQGGFQAVEATLQGQGSCQFDQTPPFNDAQFTGKGAGQAVLHDKQRNKKYVISVKDIECADIAGANVNP